MKSVTTEADMAKRKTFVSVIHLFIFIIDASVIHFGALDIEVGCNGFCHISGYIFF